MPDLALILIAGLGALGVVGLLALTFGGRS